MLVTKLIYALVFLSSTVSSYTLHKNIPYTNNIRISANQKYPTMQDSSESYLEKINAQPVKKQEPIRKKITNSIKPLNAHKNEKGFVSTFYAIPKANFDTIFLNIYQISIIYFSSNVDRMIFELKTGKRFVYYITDNAEYEKINQLVNLIPHKIKHIIINDVKNTMDDIFGHLYCEPK